MAVRFEEQRERREPPRSTTPTRTSTAPAQRGDSEVHEVSLTQLRAKFPGLVSMGQGG